MKGFTIKKSKYTMKNNTFNTKGLVRKSVCIAISLVVFLSPVSSTLADLRSADDPHGRKAFAELMHKRDLLFDPEYDPDANNGIIYYDTLDDGTKFRLYKNGEFTFKHEGESGTGTWIYRGQLLSLFFKGKIFKVFNVAEKNLGDLAPFDPETQSELDNNLKRLQGLIENFESKIKLVKEAESRKLGNAQAQAEAYKEKADAAVAKANINKQKADAYLAQIAREKGNTKNAIAQAEANKKRADAALDQAEVYKGQVDVALKRANAALVQVDVEKKRAAEALAQAKVYKGQVDAALARAAVEKIKADKALAQLDLEKDKTDAALAQAKANQAKADEALAQAAADVAQAASDVRKANGALAQFAEKVEAINSALDMSISPAPAIGMRKPSPQPALGRSAPSPRSIGQPVPSLRPVPTQPRGPQVPSPRLLALGMQAPSPRSEGNISNGNNRNTAPLTPGERMIKESIFGLIPNKPQPSAASIANGIIKNMNKKSAARSERFLQEQQIAREAHQQRENERLAKLREDEARRTREWNKRNSDYAAQQTAQRARLKMLEKDQDLRAAAQRAAQNRTITQSQPYNRPSYIPSFNAPRSIGSSPTIKRQNYSRYW